MEEVNITYDFHVRLEWNKTLNCLSTDLSTVNRFLKSNLLDHILFRSNDCKGTPIFSLVEENEIVLISDLNNSCEIDYALIKDKNIFIRDYHNKDPYTIYMYNKSALNEGRKQNITANHYPDTAEGLNKNDINDNSNASRGFLKGTALSKVIRCANGASAWDMPSYDFMQGEAPDTVNPVLWRMEKLNNYNGLFQVLPKVNDGQRGGKNGDIYQIRTYDLATMTIVKSSTGWIVIDPLGGKETAAVAWKCFKENVDEAAQVRAILITHSHVDHYKGVEGIIGKEEILDGKQEDYTDEKKVTTIPAGKTLVVAPDGFYDEAISENLYLGNCMSRRAVYMYGSSLPHDSKGQVGCGLGKTVGTETGSLLLPSFELKMDDGAFIDLYIDGLKIIFQNVPGTEAPAEFHIYLDKYAALCPGENITYTQHNLLTPRGAKVRDPKAFAKAIDDAINHFGKTEVIIGTHHWPTWGNAECLGMMRKQRDMYRFFNDQVIRMVNKGMNMEEIAESFKLPASLDSEYYNRGYYGTVNHNVKAVVQRYVGWWDGNPANYFKYPDTEVAKRFVADMGGEGKVLAKAKEYFKEGDYRWCVELTRQLVFNNPRFHDARYLEADALEQLAYSFEAGTWRNIFLSAAFELRGIRMGDTLPQAPEQFIGYAATTLASLTPEYAFDYLATLIDTKKVNGVERTYTIRFGEENNYTYYQAEVANSVLHFAQGSYAETPDMAFESMADFASDFNAYMKNIRKLDVAEGTATNDSNKKELFGYFDTLDGQWNIIEPLAD